MKRARLLGLADFPTRSIRLPRPAIGAILGTMFICSSHPRAAAAWVCTKCGKNLCEDCAAEQQIQGGTLVRCTACDGVAEALMRPKEVRPYWALMHVFFLNMFKPDRLLTLAVLGGALAFLAWVARMAGLASIFVWFVYLGVYASYYFLVIRKSADGMVELPEGSDMSDIFDLLGTAMRFIGAMAMIWLPALIYILLGDGFWAFLAYPHLDPVLIILLIVGLLYAPGAIITAAITEDTAAVFNPLNVLAIAARIPGQYVTTVVAWIILTVVGKFVNGWLNMAFYKLSLPVVGPWLNEILSLFLPLLGAFMLGRLIYQNGQALEYVDARDLVEPALPGARPRHEFRQEDREQVQPRGPVVPIELSDDEEGPATIGGQAAPDVRLRQAIEAGDQQAALSALAELAGRGLPVQLQPREELRLAGFLERAGRHLEAAQACRRAADQDLRGPFASRAIFTAGRLLVEQVGNPQQGAAMLRYLVEHFPQDELSLRAAEMLRRLE